MPTIGMVMLEHVHPGRSPHVLGGFRKALGRAGVAEDVAEVPLQALGFWLRVIEGVGTCLLPP